MEDQLLTPRQVAARLNLTTRAVYHRIRNGQLHVNPQGLIDAGSIGVPYLRPMQRRFLAVTSLLRTRRALAILKMGGRN